MPTETKVPLQAVVGVICDALSDLSPDDQTRALKAVRVTLDLRAVLARSPPDPTVQEALTRTQRDLDTWRSCHLELAELLSATGRGRAHFDSMLVISAIKRAFRIVRIEVSQDASEVQITTADGRTHTVPTQEENT